MKKRNFTFSNTTVTYLFDAEFAQLEKLTTREKAVIITDENVFGKHKNQESNIRFSKPWMWSLIN